MKKLTSMLALALALLSTAAPLFAKEAKESSTDAIKKVVLGQLDQFEGNSMSGSVPATKDAWFQFVNAGDVGLDADGLAAAQGKFGFDHQKEYTERQLGDVAVSIGKDESVAWASFTMSLVDGKKTAFTFRATELFAKVDGDWVVVSGVWSLPMSDADATKGLKAGTLAKAATLTKSGKDEGDTSITDMTVLFFDPESKTSASSLSSRSDFLAIGSTLNEKYNAKQLGALLATMKGKLGFDGSSRAGLAPGGNAAWAVSNLTWPMPGNLVLPLRAFLVFEKEPTTKGHDGGWKIVAAHFSIAR
jgi:hypothetical protein